MSRAAVSLEFRHLPSAFRYFPRAVFGRRAVLVPDGQSVPRLEGRVASVRPRASHVARYRRLCSFADDGLLPITYPHVLAMPLHIALLTHRQFVVRLMGLIHIGNECHQARPMPQDGRYRIRTWIEGHRDSDRGQEFDLYTEFDDDAGVAWQEKTIFLARRSTSMGQAARSARQTLRYEKPAEGERPVVVPIVAPKEVGRRYGWLSGDLNPIHLGDRGAKLFGFDRAVAHGMWSMARTLAALPQGLLAAPV